MLFNLCREASSTCGRARIPLDSECCSRRPRRLVGQVGREGCSHGRGGAGRQEEDGTHEAGADAGTWKNQCSERLGKSEAMGTHSVYSSSLTCGVVVNLFFLLLQVR